MQARTVKVIIVDDHPSIRLGISKLIEGSKDHEFCGEAGNINEAINVIKKVEPDVVIVDLSFKGEMDGIDLLKSIKQRYPKIKSIVHSMFDEAVYAERAVKAGADGYVQKDEDPKKIIEAINCVMSGNLYLNDSIKDDIINKLLKNPHSSDRPEVDSLTNREFEIYQLFGKGLTIKELAKKLHLSTQTLETHRRNIKQKLKIPSNSMLIKHAANWLSIHSPNKNY